ncbi:hypothetical protein BI347_00100 [Chromobacterium sphagni]|uniref:Flagellar hook-basal body complex protein FliE n=1 Tax=Chromobacterium sphagni TaxID=1903179 RepID=A0A1S1WYC9_9NEIS|nr:flagellar hook-basal body complex protein FliE [Chromobacterium sphagni]OHX12068.1 hypothetical protein BI347_00100 [Chromobacterium sphagni]
MIDAIAGAGPIHALQALQGSGPVGAVEPQAAPSVAGGFERILTQVEQSEKGIGALLNDVATGQAGNLHQVMLKMEETRMQFELFMQARNKALEAYQEVMRIQV